MEYEILSYESAKVDPDIDPVKLLPDRFKSTDLKLTTEKMLQTINNTFSLIVRDAMSIVWGFLYS